MQRPIRSVGPLLAIGSALILVASVLTTGLTASAAGPTRVGLGTADGFAVLGGSGITNTGTTTIGGDVGTFPTTTESGMGACPAAGCVTLTGTDHAGDATTQGAKTDLVTAYNAAAGRTPVTTIPTELGTTTLAPGTYTAASGTFGLTGTVTLDGGGDATSVFIFQMGTTLTTATSSVVRLIGSQQSCNVFWQVGSSATLGGSTTFRGNILALTSITLVTSATVDGRLLARNGLVTLDTNTITKATCAAVPTPTPTATATPPPGGGGGTPPPGGGGGSAPVEREPVAIAPTAAPAPARSAAPTAFPMDQGYPMVQGTPTPGAGPTPGAAVLLPSSSTGGGDSSLILLTGLSVVALSTVWLRSRRRDRDPTA